MSGVDVGRLRTGWIDNGVASEFPDLGLHWARAIVSFLPAPRRRAREGLRDLSARHPTGRTVLMGTDPTAQAHDVFYRRIGLNPDVPPRPPAQAVMAERLLQGEFKSRSLIEDASLIALLETGVRVTALDATDFSDALGIREARRGESIPGARGDESLPTGRLVIAGNGAPMCAVFGKISRPWQVQKATAEVLLFAVRPPGVSGMQADEALWMVRSILTGEPVSRQRVGRRA